MSNTACRTRQLDDAVRSSSNVVAIPADEIHSPAFGFLLTSLFLKNRDARLVGKAGSAEQKIMGI